MNGDASEADLNPDFLARKGLTGRLPELIQKVERIVGTEVPQDDETKPSAHVH
jgi:hypothetical protein